MVLARIAAAAVVIVAIDDGMVTIATTAGRPQEVEQVTAAQLPR